MRNATVLIAEDSHDDYFLIQRAFRKAEIPAQLIWVKDGSEAKAYFLAEGSYANRKQFPLPILILGDLKMPRMNGFELLNWVRSRPEFRRIPFVVLTSSSQSPDINRAYDMGANSYLVKPGRFEDLLQLSQALKTYWLTLNKNPETPVS
jgi:CheY-like chemotaxis protein